MAKKHEIINTATDLQGALVELVQGIRHAHDRARDMALLDFDELRDLQAAWNQISLVNDRMGFRLEAIREAQRENG